MQDIDFDELDRAVNSVISPGSDDTSVTVSNQKPAERSLNVPERSAPSSPAARRSSGRFMDVVHPSSDMRPATTVPERPAPETPVPDSSSESDAFKWPDPMELEGTHSDTTADTTPEPEASQESSPSQPLESPFLSDAKVEKRPLGGMPPPELPTTDMSPSLSDTMAADEPQPAAGGDADMPVELNEDILKAEEAEAPESPAESFESTASETLATTSTPVIEAPVGPASITQQYKEQPSTTDQPSGAIYDTESYHQPLTHTPKKHSGLLIVVWILALILIGGGMGAAVYFFVLPML